MLQPHENKVLSLSILCMRCVRGEQNIVPFELGNTTKDTMQSITFHTKGVGPDSMDDNRT